MKPNETNNFREFTNLVKSANNEVRNLSIMYWINQANKLARKNEYLNGTNVHDLGLEVREYCKKYGIEISNADFFTARMFTKVNNLACYKKTIHKKANGKFAIDEDVITWQYVIKPNSSVSGLVQLFNAIKYILGIDAKEIDKNARANDTKERRERREQLKREQQNARKLFASGKMSVEEFAKIMIKAI